jgi:hypothetical protein
MEGLPVVERPLGGPLPAGPAERRRPGRPASVAPVLLPLLRVATERYADAFEALDSDPDQLRPARGLGLALLVSVTVWAGLIWLAPTVVRFFWS